jgi:hypothetical protein
MTEPWRMRLYLFADTPEATRIPRGSILSLRPEEVNPERLGAYGKDELASLAMVLNVPHSGTKAKTIERIMTGLELRHFLRHFTRDQLKVLPAKYLRKRLKSMGLFAGLNRYGMAGALLQWRNQCRLEGRMRLARANHYRLVRAAVMRGEPVPDDVLDDHPSLRSADFQPVRVRTGAERSHSDGENHEEDRPPANPSNDRRLPALARRSSELVKPDHDF